MHVGNPKGFTLIELVIGIMVLSIALMLFTSLLIPQAVRSVDPIFQVRATELAKSIMIEITSKAFDEESSHTVTGDRCNENGIACTSSDQLGVDGTENRTTFNDIDDYHGLNASAGGIIKNALDQLNTIGGQDLYQGFLAEVSVVYDDNFNGVDDSDIIEQGIIVTGNTKLITVTITTPNNEAMIFSTYKLNY
jgi:MSHA pilin protein MshD